MTIQEMFDGIMVGNSTVINVESIAMLNNTALELYNIPTLNPEQVELLKKIIMICNVVYNRTDMTVLPIEDGFYDVLLEKYKQYDSNFQVGSAVVEFRNFIENDIANPRKIAKPAIIFLDKQKKKDDIHQETFDNINRFYPLNIRDFAKPAIYFDNDYISKRSHNTEHNHPSLVGTLDKAKFVLNQDAIDAGVFNDDNVKVLERDFFQDHIAKGIINPNKTYTIICELKYDGISVEADCNTHVISARTRGDTGIGVASDLTPILKDYPFKQATCMIGQEPIGVKFEAIMTKANLERFNLCRGRSYANCRSAIVGLFGASDAYLFRDFITLVPLAMDIENSNIPLSNRLEEINFINRVFVSHGEPLRYQVFTGTIPQLLYYIKVFWEEAKASRDYLNFMYDGIVISYFENDVREKLGRKNYINKYSMAVKFDPIEKQTIFRGYTFEVGQNGTITPMIHYDPVEFLGTIHTKSTGSSYNRFQELNLKYGDFINVKYVNDVMPYVSKVECEHNDTNPNPPVEFIKTCPICGSELVLSDSGKTIKCTNLNCLGRSIQRMVNMFQKMNLKGFSDAAFTTLRKTHLYELFEFTEDQLINLLGDADGRGFFATLNMLRTEPIKDYIVIGALGFTGIAHKKWQSILQGTTIGDLENLYLSCARDTLLFEVALNKQFPAIGEVTTHTIATEWGVFEDDIIFILQNMKIINSLGSGDAKMQIRFTGFRNLQLSQQLNTAGYDADDNGSLTKKTDILLIPYEGFTSTKVTKAMANPRTKIIPVNEFVANMKKYIGEDLQDK